MQHYFAESIVNNIVTLCPEDEHHLLNVMRIRDKDEIIAIYQTHKFLCRIELNLKGVIIHVVKEIITNNELSTKVTLIYSMPKGDKFELVLQKAAELGVYQIVPLLSERSLIKYDASKSKHQRWHRILKEASEQSRRNMIPLISEPISNDEVKLFLSDLNLIGNENLNKDTNEQFANLLAQKWPSITIIVGCEGGFSQNEFKMYEKLGFKSISFGHRILRSETAAIYAMSIIAFMCEK